MIQMSMIQMSVIELGLKNNAFRKVAKFYTVQQN